MIPLAESIEQWQAEICKAVGHPTRIRILQLLRDGERCVCEIYPALAEEQSNISRHLAILKQKGLLSSRKEGLKVIYRVNDERIFDLLDLVTEMIRLLHAAQHKVLAP